MKKYKAVIYDIDGTILNTLDMNMYPLLQIIKEELGEEWTMEQVLKFAAYPGMKVMEELQVKDKEKTYARWVQYVNEYEEGAKLFDGFIEVFETFQEHFLQAIVSSKRTAQYQIDIVDKSLDQYMVTAVLAEHTTKHKPHPDPILECLKRINVAPHEAIYIGDTIFDYLAANHAGLDFGFAKWGSTSSEGIEEPTYIFEQPLDLLQLVR